MFSGYLCGWVAKKGGKLPPQTIGDVNDLVTEFMENIQPVDPDEKEMQAIFNLRWKADMRAIKIWQKAHPDSPIDWPDHADMVVWLLEQLDDKDSP